ncbi:MAG: TldD/PmbA family protein [Defluviitaleaceae bacterium]|nr:TldD/PmbA family protein [Defluviitaleaceae bacterium]
MQKVPASNFLQEKKPWLQKLVTMLEKEFTYVSALGTDVMGKRYSVSNKVTSISDGGGWSERGFVVRVYKDGCYFEYSFNNMPENTAELEALTIQITESASKQSGTAFLYPQPVDEPLVQTYHGEVEELPGNLGPDQIIARMKNLNKKMRDVSPLVVEASVSVSYAKTSKIFVSTKKDLEQHYYWADAYLSSTVRREKTTRSLHKSFSGMMGLEILALMDSGLEEVVQNACKLLDAKPTPPGEYDVICSPDAVGIIAHEAFGHGVELDMFIKNRANAKDYMGQPVASPIVRMHDGAKATRHVASYLFDDEGNLAGDTTIIENGILKAGISDALSAAALGLSPTGNGRRQAYSNKAYSRMTNTFISPGTDKLEDMIKSVKHGYLIEDAASGMEDPKDWGIQCMFTCAREIIDGKITDNWVAPVVMTGYVPDLLKAITMVSDDFEFSGAGGCGKGYKEWVKVSCGGPYIKTRARLG